MTIELGFMPWALKFQMDYYFLSNVYILNLFYSRQISKN